MFKKITTSQLLLIILIIILLIPPLLINFHFYKWFDYTNTGEIGDTLGGITSPFINGLAALLVFITFKEQVKANKLIQEQIYFQHIQEQINRLEEDFLEISKITKSIDNEIYIKISEESKIIGNEEPYSFSIDERRLNKIMYSTIIFNQISKSINNISNNENKTFFNEKLALLFKIIYKKNYSELVKIFNSALLHNCKQNEYIKEIITEMRNLNDSYK